MSKPSKIRTLAPAVRLMPMRLAPRPKSVDAAYRTQAHKAWRDAVIQRAGRRCEAPGCGRSDARMYADHIRELKDGGLALDLSNGQCLCASHHTAKTAAARAERSR